MKKHKIIVLTILIILLSFYWISLYALGKKEETIVNSIENENENTLPRLEDDFYTYINHDYLSQNKLSDDEISIYNFDKTDEIEEEKEIIIKELINEDSEIGHKMKYFYNSYMKSIEEENILELNVYINKINDSKNIEEYVKNVIDINYKLDTDILISPNVMFNMKGSSKKYFGLDLITYDWDNTLSYYTIEEYEDIIRMYKKYNIQILKEYGFTPNEALNISDDVQKLYKEISRFSKLNQMNLLEDGYKIYKFDDLQKEIKNIPLESLISYYKEFYNDEDEILVADINQLKMIDEYLKEENLDTLKNYAMLKILTTYSKYISEDYYKIYYDYICESQNYLKKEEYTKEELVHKQIYLFFEDSITEVFAKKYFSESQKKFYTDLIIREIEIYKDRIKNADWLGDDTKEKALKKLENMTYIVGIPEEFSKVENRYKIDYENTYITNLINMKQNMKEEEMKQYEKGNILYNYNGIDQLTVNAYYLPNNNSINLLLGYIYSINKVFGFDETNLQNNYYKILGGIGTTIGHELSHALDTTGAKYDENGNYINWWSEEDRYNFNLLTSKVVKYYEKYEQYGDKTIGENIADLGGMAIVLQIAEENNAQEEDYKEIFEAYAKIWASQFTTIAKEYLLKNDEHSPSKNRVNAVLATFEKFYEVYGISENDKMYVKPSDRVKVW